MTVLGPGRVLSRQQREDTNEKALANGRWYPAGVEVREPWSSIDLKTTPNSFTSLSQQRCGRCLDCLPVLWDLWRQLAIASPRRLTSKGAGIIELPDELLKQMGIEDLRPLPRRSAKVFCRCCKDKVTPSRR
ncbi:hypothetical protein D3C87_1538250 [compost metagenome]